MMTGYFGNDRAAPIRFIRLFFTFRRSPNLAVALLSKGDKTEPNLATTKLNLSDLNRSRRQEIHTRFPDIPNISIAGCVCLGALGQQTSSECETRCAFLGTRREGYGAEQ